GVRRQNHPGASNAGRRAGKPGYYHRRAVKERLNGCRPRPNRAGGSLIRVWIGTVSAVTRAGLEVLLESLGGVELVESVSNADVALLDELPERPGALPTVILSDEPLTSRWLRLGVHA